MDKYKLKAKKIKPILGDEEEFFTAEDSGLLVDSKDDEYCIAASAYVNKKGLYLTIELYGDDKTLGYFFEYRDVKKALIYMITDDVDEIELFKLKQEMGPDYNVSFLGDFIYFGPDEICLDIDDAYDYWEREYGIPISQPDPEEDDTEETIKLVEPEKTSKKAAKQAKTKEDSDKDKITKEIKEQKWEFEKKVFVPSRTSSGNILFGQYGGEQIEWLVLQRVSKRINGKRGIRLLSLKAIDNMPEGMIHTHDWENSQVRTLLNNEFYNNAFSDDEKKIK